MFVKKRIEKITQIIRGTENYVEIEKALKKLRVIRSRRAVEPLIPLLEEKNDLLSKTAAELLGNMADPRAVVPLINVLQRQRTVCSAAESLGKLGDRRAVEPLIEVLKKQNIHARISAAEALGKLKDIRALEPLSEIITNRFHDFGINYKYNDLKYTEICKIRKKELYRKMLKATAQALGDLGDKRAVPFLIDTLDDYDPIQNIIAIEALEKLGEYQWRDIVKCNTGDVKRLKEIRNPNTVNILLRLADEEIYRDARNIDPEDKFGSKEVSTALLDLYDSRVTEYLLHMRLRTCEVDNTDIDGHFYITGDEPAQSFASWMLGKMGTVAADHLVNIINHNKNSIVRLKAIIVLAMMRDIRALGLLLSILNEDIDKSFEMEAVRALGELGDIRAIEPLMNKLSSFDDKTRKEAEEVLKKQQTETQGRYG